MTYRDVPATCPRCNVALRGRRRRDIWQCSRCGGVHLAVAELERWLRLAAPDLAGDVIAAARAPRQRLDEVAAPSAAPAIAAAALVCPTCPRQLRGLVLEGVAAQRCDASGELWFDGPRLGELFATVDDRQRAQRSWLARVLEHFFVS